MAQDFALPVRRAILPLLKAGQVVTALIPAAQIHPSKVPPKPVFPFIRYGASIVAPFRASGLDSCAITVAVHAFTKSATNGAGQVTATAEDQAHLMAAAIGACLDGATLTLPDGYKARIAWTGTNLLADGSEADAWHAVVNLRVEVAA